MPQGFGPCGRAPRRALDSNAVSSSASLTATTGRTTGSAESRRLRGTDQIPGVLYGRGMEPVSITVGRRDLRNALSGPAGVNTILDLSVDGTTYNAIVKELQRHPVKRNVSHVDFIQIDMSAELTVSIPVRLEGTAKAVVSEGGLVDPAVDTIEVRCTPRNVPNEIVIDVTDMQVTDVIRLSAVSFPAGVTPTGDPEMPVVTVLTLRQDAAPTAAAGEGATEASAGESGEQTAADSDSQG